MKQCEALARRRVSWQRISISATNRTDDYFFGSDTSASCLPALTERLFTLRPGPFQIQTVVLIPPAGNPWGPLGFQGYFFYGSGQRGKVL